MEYVRKGDLNSPTKFKQRFPKYISSLQKHIEDDSGILLSFDVVGNLVLSACRCNEFNVLYLIGKKLYINEDNIMNWVDDRFLPNYIELHTSDPDILKLLVFSFQITYKMFGGGSRATKTAKGSRSSYRTFETILVNQFVGKLGEIVTQKFLSDKFNIDIQLDWEISTEIKKFRNDIPNASKLVSIKTTSNMSGIWAEADNDYAFGISAKCHVPQAPILLFLNESGGYEKLLDFVSKGLPDDKGLFSKYLKEIAAEMETERNDPSRALGGYMLGFFDTDDYDPIEKDVKLEYLGKVNESRYLVKINELRHSDDDWKAMIKEAGIK